MRYCHWLAAKGFVIKDFLRQAFIDSLVSKSGFDIWFLQSARSKPCIIRELSEPAASQFGEGERLRNKALAISIAFDPDFWP